MKVKFNGLRTENFAESLGIFANQKMCESTYCLCHPCYLSASHEMLSSRSIRLSWSTSNHSTAPSIPTVLTLCLVFTAVSMPRTYFSQPLLFQHLVQPAHHKLLEEIGVSNGDITRLETKGLPRNPLAYSHLDLHLLLHIQGIGWPLLAESNKYLMHQKTM